MSKFQTLDELFAPIEAERLLLARLEIAAEQTAWANMTAEEQAAYIAASEAKFADTPDPEPCDTCGLPEGDPNCECGYDMTDMDDDE